MKIEEVIFSKPNSRIHRNELLSNRCISGDILTMMRLYNYQIDWNGEKRSIRYYTNITVQSLLDYLFEKLGIQKEEQARYKLENKGRAMRSSDLIPLDGIPELQLGTEYHSIVM